MYVFNREPATRRIESIVAIIALKTAAMTTSRWRQKHETNVGTVVRHWQIGQKHPSSDRYQVAQM
jgi:hypothetical protein